MKTLDRFRRRIGGLGSGGRTGLGSRGRTRTDVQIRQPGRRVVDGPALAERIAAADVHRQCLRASDRSRGKKLELVPALATDWKQTGPTVWRFNLRKNVQFHDGTPFTADDVIFSYNRSKGDGSDVKSKSARSRRSASSTTTRSTSSPTSRSRSCPTCSPTGTSCRKKWCEENRAVQPVDKRKGTENTASFKANGTGPYRLRVARSERAHDAATQSRLLGQDRRQRPGGGVHADRQRIDPGRCACCRAKST